VTGAACRPAGSTGHNDYLFNITRTLLELAVERGGIADVDTSAVARVMAGLGSDFIRPDVIPTLRSSSKDAADTVVDLMLSGLRGGPSPRQRKGSR
jgi:hypothetical protein